MILKSPVLCLCVLFNFFTCIKGRRIPDEAICSEFNEVLANGSKILKSCPYPQLFSTDTLTCMDFIEVDCHNRIEYTSPCNYTDSNCTSRENDRVCECLDPPDLNFDMCQNLEDGNYVWPNRTWTAYYVECQQNRTIPQKCQGQSEIFDFIDHQRQCVTKEAMVNKANSLNSNISIPSSLQHLIVSTSYDDKTTRKSNNTSSRDIQPTRLQLTDPTSHIIQSTRQHIDPTSERIPSTSHFTNQTSRLSNTIRLTSDIVSQRTSLTGYTINPTKQPIYSSSQTIYPASHSFNLTNHFTIHLISHPVFPTSQTIKPTRYTSNSTRYTASPTKHITSPTNHTVNPTSYTINSARHTNYTVNPTKHSVSISSHPVNHTSYTINPTSHTINTLNDTVSPTKHAISPTNHIKEPNVINTSKYVSNSISNFYESTKHTFNSFSHMSNHSSHTITPANSNLTYTTIDPTKHLIDTSSNTINYSNSTIHMINPSSNTLKPTDRTIDFKSQRTSSTTQSINSLSQMINYLSHTVYATAHATDTRKTEAQLENSIQTHLASSNSSKLIPESIDSNVIFTHSQIETIEKASHSLKKSQLIAEESVIISDFSNSATSLQMSTSDKVTTHHRYTKVHFSKAVNHVMNHLDSSESSIIPSAYTMTSDVLKRTSELPTADESITPLLFSKSHTISSEVQYGTKSDFSGNHKLSASQVSEMDILPSTKTTQINPYPNESVSIKAQSDTSSLTSTPIISVVNQTNEVTMYTKHISSHENVLSVSDLEVSGNGIAATSTSDEINSSQVLSAAVESKTHDDTTPLLNRSYGEYPVSDSKVETIPATIKLSGSTPFSSLFIHTEPPSPSTSKTTNVDYPMSLVTLYPSTETSSQVATTSVTKTPSSSFLFSQTRTSEGIHPTPTLIGNKTLNNLKMVSSNVKSTKALESGSVSIKASNVLSVVPSKVVSAMFLSDSHPLSIPSQRTTPYIQGTETTSDHSCGSHVVLHSSLNDFPKVSNQIPTHISEQSGYSKHIPTSAIVHAHNTTVPYRSDALGTTSSTTETPSSILPLTDSSTTLTINTVPQDASHVISSFQPHSPSLINNQILLQASSILTISKNYDLPTSLLPLSDSSIHLTINNYLKDQAYVTSSIQHYSSNLTNTDTLKHLSTISTTKIESPVTEFQSSYLHLPESTSTLTINTAPPDPAFSISSVQPSSSSLIVTRRSSRPSIRITSAVKPIGTSNTSSYVLPIPGTTIVTIPIGPQKSVLVVPSIQPSRSSLTLSRTLSGSSSASASSVIPSTSVVTSSTVVNTTASSGTHDALSSDKIVIISTCVSIGVLVLALVVVGVAVYIKRRALTPLDHL